VPLGDGQLAGDDRRRSSVAVLEHFEQVVSMSLGRRSKAQVVELCGAPHNATKLATCHRTPVPPTCSTTSSPPVTRHVPLSSRPTSPSSSGAPSSPVPLASSPSSTASPSTARSSTSTPTPTARRGLPPRPQPALAAADPNSSEITGSGPPPTALWLHSRKARERAICPAARSRGRKLPIRPWPYRLR
jgi:hypothetical protein